MNKTDIHHYNNARGEGTVFAFDVVDSTGEIRITAFNTDCDRLYSKIQIGQVLITICAFLIVYFSVRRISIPTNLLRFIMLPKLLSNRSIVNTTSYHQTMNWLLHKALSFVKVWLNLMSKFQHRGTTLSDYVMSKINEQMQSSVIFILNIVLLQNFALQTISVITNHAYQIVRLVVSHDLH